MGQYYMLVNLDKKQSMDPHAGMFRNGTQLSFSKYTSGAKMADQLYSLGVKPLLALALISVDSDEKYSNPLWGSWAGDRVVLIGDYSDDLPEFLTEAEVSEMQLRGGNLYKQSYGEMAADAAAWFREEDRLGDIVGSAYCRHVFVNTDKKEFIDPYTFGHHEHFQQYIQDQQGVMRGLFSCLFYSTGSGGGDISAFKKGRWAGDRLKLVKLAEAYDGDYKDISHEVRKLIVKCEY